MNIETRINSALNVRDQFPAIAGWHYLDSAATAQKPQAVIDAITTAYSRDYATVHRGVYERSAEMTASYEAARAAASTEGLDDGAVRLIAAGLDEAGRGSGDRSARAAACAGAAEADGDAARIATRPGERAADVETA